MLHYKLNISYTVYNNTTINTVPQLHNTNHILYVTSVQLFVPYIATRPAPQAKQD